MYLLKYLYGVTSGNLLGLVVCHRKKEVGCGKIKAIIELPTLENLTELKGLGSYLSISVGSNLSGRCQPFFRIMKKDAMLEWDEQC